MSPSLIYDRLCGLVLYNPIADNYSCSEVMISMTVSDPKRQHFIVFLLSIQILHYFCPQSRSVV